MKVITVFFLFFVSFGLNAADADKVHVGKVLQVSKQRIELDQGGSIRMIGFVGDADALLALENIKVGDEIRAVFGVTTVDPNNRRINKLLSIRACAPQDKECAADRKRQDEERAESNKQTALFLQKHTDCRNAMEATLANDARYVSRSNAPATSDYRARFNALPREKSVCGNEVVAQHQRATFEACEKHRCGDNVGGGCAHVAGYAVNESVIRKALEKCEK